MRLYRVAYSNFCGVSQGSAPRGSPCKAGLHFGRQVYVSLTTRLDIQRRAFFFEKSELD
jgi:hypothetical protein